MQPAENQEGGQQPLQGALGGSPVLPLQEAESPPPSHLPEGAGAPDGEACGLSVTAIKAGARIEGN